MKTQFCNFVTIDVGSSKIAAIAAYIETSGQINILSQNIRCSEGIKSSVITDLKKAENSIISAIYNLEQACSKSIKKTTIVLSGLGTKSSYIYAKIKLPSQQATRQDIQKLITKILASFKQKDQEIIHYFPIEFSLDDNHSIQDPLGMYGKELGCRMHLISANSNLLLNLTNCLSKCQVEVTGVILGIYASGLACLTDDERNFGVLLIDIGAKTTSFGIFFNGKLLYSYSIPVGSWHITSDIAKVLSINFKVAEKLKILYGNACFSPITKDSIINLENLDPEESYLHKQTTITTNELSQIIHPRIEEILQLLKAHYDKICVDNLIARRMVLTGGGSLLRGLEECAGKIFDKQVRIGRPHLFPGFIEDYNPNVYVGALGTIIHYAKKQKKLYLNENSTYNIKGNWFVKITKWLKENI